MKLSDIVDNLTNLGKFKSSRDAYRDPVDELVIFNGAWYAIRFFVFYVEDENKEPIEIEFGEFCEKYGLLDEEFKERTVFGDGQLKLFYFAIEDKDYGEEHLRVYATLSISETENFLFPPLETKLTFGEE